MAVLATHQLGGSTIRSLCRWQVDGKRRTAAGSRGNGNVPAKTLGQVFYDRQPKPGAAELARARFIDPVEPLEHPVHLVGRDAEAVVNHFDPRTVAVALPAHFNAAFRSGVLDGVVDEVTQDFAQAFRIRAHEERFARRRGEKRD